MTLTRRTVLFGSYCVCLSLAYVQVLRALYDYSRDNVSASHVVLIPLVSAVLIFQDKTRIFSSVRTSWAFGMAIGIVGAGLALEAGLSGGRSAAHTDWLTWIVGSFVVLSIGGFVLLYGSNASKAALFPLLFLGFMVPIPDGLVNSLTLILKTGSTETVAGLFSLTGTPYHRDGFVFTLPNLVIEVADECSGIRSSLALLLTMLLTGHAFLKRPVNKLLLVLAIFPVAILKNAIRIACLSLLAIHVDRGFMEGRLHREGGIVFFLMALVVLGPILSLLRNSEERQSMEVRTA
jgi:exosortase